MKRQVSTVRKLFVFLYYTWKRLSSQRIHSCSLPFWLHQTDNAFELESITIGVGNTNWGAPDNEYVFILKLGKCIKKMKVRTQQNFNQKTHETVFGISIMPDGGRRYCKYPIGHQEYKDYAQAHQAMKDVQKILDNGGRLVYSPKGSAGINKHEYVKIEMI